MFSSSRAVEPLEARRMFAAAPTPFLSRADVIEVAGTRQADVIELSLAAGGAVGVTVNGVRTTIQPRTVTRDA